VSLSPTIDVETVSAALERVGGRPCEIVVGAPIAAYGPRVTVADGAYGDHPWGPPDWVGLRFRGEARTKAYHRAARLPGVPRPPCALPSGLSPVMAALDGDDIELYLRHEPSAPWVAFVDAVCASLRIAPPPSVAPAPRPATGGMGLSVRWAGDEVRAVSLFASDVALPPEATLSAAWGAGLEGSDRQAYERALATAQWLAPQRAAWHAGVAWTLDLAASRWSRAVSLRL
jgi:hypothetical protein